MDPALLSGTLVVERVEVLGLITEDQSRALVVFALEPQRWHT
jgi:hypothetical protein